eukprot:3384245-Amphidinium_carterae.1
MQRGKIPKHLPPLVRLTEDSLLDRFAGFDESGKYATRAGVKRMGIEVIGQRLLTGRLVIAQAMMYHSEISDDTLRQCFIRKTLATPTLMLAHE